MAYIRHIFIVSLVAVMAAACSVEPLPEPSVPAGEGDVLISFMPAAQDEVVTRAEDSDSRIENALVFAFASDGRCLAKQWSNIEGTPAQMYMYLPSGDFYLYAVCNLLDPETVMNRVESLGDLQEEAVTITDITGAFKGNYIMSGNTGIVQKPSDRKSPVRIPVTRLAAQFNLRLVFAPLASTDQLQISKVSVHNVPSGSWVLQRNSSERHSLENVSSPVNPDTDFVLSHVGSADDWTFDRAQGNMERRYFTQGTIQMSGTDIKDGLEGSFSMFENRRGILDTSISDPALESDAFAVNWPQLYLRTEAERRAYAQLWKKGLADNAAGIADSHSLTAGIGYATYLTIEGVYMMGQNMRREVTYYVYLGNDNFSSFDVERNHRYNMEVTIHTIDQADTRVDWEDLSTMKVYYDEEAELDAHCNSVQTLLYSPGNWEVWVENPDDTPWLELSVSGDYKPMFLGSPGTDGTAGFRIEGEAGMRYIYIHTDEYVPDLGSPEANNSVSERIGTVCYRRKGSAQVSRFTVTQYPAQMVILHIGYDVHTMKEVRDTFYIERLLEKKHLKWGFDTYWSFDMDDMIASGQWDGLSNTRRLYDAALVGDKWGIGPAYPESEYSGEGPDRIPDNVALRYILEKNRDRNGNGYIDRDEIMWFMPAINEMEALYDAKGDLLVQFDNSDEYFFSSSPSSADPNGITYGYAYYIKMGNGKTGLANRLNEYNVIACRRTNAWKGPQTAGGEGTVGKDDGWNEEEVIMPKE